MMFALLDRLWLKSWKIFQKYSLNFQKKYGHILWFGGMYMQGIAKTNIDDSLEFSRTSYNVPLIGYVYLITGDMCLFSRISFSMNSSRPVHF